MVQWKSLCIFVIVSFLSLGPALFHFHDCGRVSQTNNLSKSIQLQLIWRNVLEPGMFPHDGIHNWGGGNSNIFYFHRDPWGNDPIWRAYFSKGLQPLTSNVFFGSKDSYLESQKKHWKRKRATWRTPMVMIGNCDHTNTIPILYFLPFVRCLL